MMGRYNAGLLYPKEKFHIILQSSSKSDEYYGLDDLERRKLRIIQAKYGCRHCFHTLPDQVTLQLNKFIWNNTMQCFEIDFNKKVSVKLNTLEETIISYEHNDDYLDYLG